MPAFAWTRRLPRKPGYYWMMYFSKDAGDTFPVVVEVMEYSDHVGLVVEDIGIEGHSRLSEYEGHWWHGPLPCPPFPVPPKKG